jgi:hypothetical protein
VVRSRRLRGGRCWKLRCGGEDWGSDCFFCLLFKVLYVKSQDHVVIPDLFQGPATNLYPPTMF